MKPPRFKIFHWVRPDYLVVTFLLFFTVANIGLVTINLSFFDPIEKALSDFSFSDLLYSKLASKQENLDTNIILVNIGHLNRAQIANQIRRISSYQPKVIGFDGFFSMRRDSAVDAQLQAAFRETPNFVMACYVTGKEAEEGRFDSLETSDPYFTSGKRALVNLGGANPETSTIRNFSPVEVFRLYKTANLSINSTWFLVPVLVYETFLKWHERSVAMIGKRYWVPKVFLPPKS